MFGVRPGANRDAAARPAPAPEDAARPVASLELRLLGPMEVRWASEPVLLPSTTGSALLAYLAVEANRAHSREHLAALFWPDHRQSAAYANLRQTLARLRRSLADHAVPASLLAVSPQSIRIATEMVDVDVTRFEQLVASCASHAALHGSGDRHVCGACGERWEEAARLYRGELLAELHVDAGQPFEEWLVVRRESLRREAQGGLQTLLASHEWSGDHESVHRCALALITVDPWGEGAHRAAMRALALMGDRAGALAHYEASRRTLEADLGVEPGEETVALFEAIRDGRVAPTARQVAVPTNLPADLTTFVGRETELAELDVLRTEEHARLVTLSGVGGMGKTRLAVEFARSQLGRFADGVFVVWLAPLTTTAAIVPTIATALGLTLNAGDPHYGGDARNALLTVLRNKKMLLVLDNFEHLLDGVDIVAEILQVAPGVEVVVTSRQPLNLRGEHHFVVRGLPYRTLVEGPDRIRRPAVQLFVHAARRVRPEFSLGGADDAEVQRICELVDGMPLGLELAAAWSETLGPQEIADEIERSLDFLEADWRDVPERQRSMRAVFESSWRLLAEDELAAFRALAVFRGGFTRQAALEVAGAPLPVLVALVRKALLTRVGSGADAAAARYEIHELLRQFVIQKLDANAAEPSRVALAHASYFLGLAETTTSKFASPDASIWLDGIEREHDNVRAALQWATETDATALGLRLAVALWPFWQRRCHLIEGRRWFDALLAASTADGVEPDLLAAAYVGAAWLAHDQDDFERADALFDASLHLDRAIGTTSRTVAVLAHRSVMARGQGRYREAIALVEESLALARAAGDETGVAYALFRMGLVTREHGEYDRAAAAYTDCLSMYRQLGDRSGESFALLGLGDIARDRGEHAEVVTYCEQSLEIAREVGRRWGVGFTLNNLALAAMMRGDLDVAADAARDARQIFEAHGIRGGVLELLVTIGQVSLARGDIRGASLSLVDALVRGWPAGPLWLVATCLEEFARVAHAEGRSAEAVALCTAAGSWREVMEAPLPPYRRVTYQATLDAARLVLGAETFDAAARDGANWTPERAVTVARSIATLTVTAIQTAN